MQDAVVVPVYEDESEPGTLRPQLRSGELADCTRVQNVPQEFLGQRLGTCPEEPWVRIRMGVRLHLDLDNRVKQHRNPAGSVHRATWWPRQNEVHFAAYPGIPTDKLFGVVSDAQWNSRAAAEYCSAVRLTSRSKASRRRWEVPVSGGNVVCGDIYLLPYENMDRRSPAPRYPDRLSDDESARIAINQKRTLTLQ